MGLLGKMDAQVEPFLEERLQNSNSKTELNEIKKVEVEAKSKHVHLSEWIKEFNVKDLRICFSWKFFTITLFFGLVPSILALVTNVTNGVSFIRGNHYELIQGNCSEHDFYFDDDDDDDDDDDEIVSKH